MRFTLQSSQAVSVDCKDVVTLLGGGSMPDFIEGFVEFRWFLRGTCQPQILLVLLASTRLWDAL